MKSLQKHYKFVIIMTTTKTLHNCTHKHNETNFLTTGSHFFSSKQKLHNHWLHSRTFSHLLSEYQQIASFQKKNDNNIVSLCVLIKCYSSSLLSFQVSLPNAH